MEEILAQATAIVAMTIIVPMAYHFVANVVNKQSLSNVITAKKMKDAANDHSAINEGMKSQVLASLSGRVSLNNANSIEELRKVAGTPS